MCRFNAAWHLCCTRYMSEVTRSSRYPARAESVIQVSFVFGRGIYEKAILVDLCACFVLRIACYGGWLGIP